MFLTILLSLGTKLQPIDIVAQKLVKVIKGADLSVIVQSSAIIINVDQYETSKLFLVWCIISNMRVASHCLPCKFIDIKMAKQHSDLTGLELMERER